MKLSKALWLSAVIGLVGTAASAQQVLTGTVASFDEKNGTITFKETQSGTVGETGAAQELKVQDGLVLNALHPGEKVTFTVTDINGTKTITKLSKQ